MGDSLEKGRLRRRSAQVLAVLAVAALCVMIVSSWMQRQIFDSARFADHAQVALKGQAVRDYAARSVTDQLINEVAPDAVAVGPLIETVSGAVIQSDAFGRAFRSSVLQLHRAAVTGDTQGAVLTVANVGVLVSGALERVAPSFAKQIPEGFEAGLLQLANMRAVNGLVDAARYSRTTTLVSALAALLLFVLAFVISPRRRRLLRSVGLELVAASVVLVAFWLMLRALIVHQAGTGELEVAALEEVWEAFMYGLVVNAALLGGIGVVIAASADGALTGINLEERVAGLTERLLNPPERTALRVLWAFAVMILGLAIARNPGDVARALVAIAGVLLAARGFQALVLLVAPPEPEHPEAVTAAVRERHRRRRRLAVVVGTAVLAVLVVGGLLDARYGQGLQTLGIVHSTTACNGSDSLCAKPLNEVALPTTHNSMSAQTTPGFLFPMQEKGIAGQLADGIRGLQIDVYYGYPGARVYTDNERSSPEAREVMKEEFGDDFVAAADRIRRQLSQPEGVAPQLYLCHGFCELGATALKEAAAEIREFLKANPREFVSIIFEDYVPWQSLAAAMEQAGLDRYGYRGPWGGKLPTLGSSIDHGRRLLLLTENAKPGVPWMHNAYEFFQETPFRFTTIAELKSPNSCREERGEPENPMFLINHWVDTPPNPRPSVARQVNRFDVLWKRVEHCRAVRKHFPNMVSVDFYRQGDLMQVVDKLNDVR